jgi:hypothetical protein
LTTTRSELQALRRQQSELEATTSGKAALESDERLPTALLQRCGAAAVARNGDEPVLSGAEIIAACDGARALDVAQRYLAAHRHATSLHAALLEQCRQLADWLAPSTLDTQLVRGDALDTLRTRVAQQTHHCQRLLTAAAALRANANLARLASLLSALARSATSTLRSCWMT